METGQEKGVGIRCLGGTKKSRGILYYKNLQRRVKLGDGVGPPCRRERTTLTSRPRSEMRDSHRY